MSVAVNGDDHSVDSNPDETQATEDTEQDLMEDVQDEVQKVKSHETAIEEAFEDLGMDEGEDQDEPNFDESTGDDFEDRNEEFLCQICNENLKTPKVLSCLHVYCQECLEKQVEPSSPNEDEPVVKQNSIITCLICKQETVVGPKGVAELQPDNVMVNLQDMEAINRMRIICTSCKANEKAVARCSDCANFLCPNCVTAHQYMRCFEKHKVVSFEDMGSGFSLHKPLFCANHSTESLKYFCLACQIPVCTECMVTLHKHPEHQCERIGELDDKLKNEVGALVKEARSKEMYCQHATSNLENSLTELQMQRDNARGLIEETFQTYRTILEEQKKHMLYELEDIHNQQEDEIMHVFDNVGKTIEKIQDSCKFTERVMQQGNCTEVLLVKRLIFTQLMSLINNTPRAEVKVKIKFSTNANKFREAIKTTFGCFTTAHIVPTSGFHSSFMEGINLSGNLLGAGDTGSLFSADLAQELSATLAPLSLTSVAGSAGLSGVSPQTINSIASSIQSLTGGGPSHVTPPSTTPGAPGQPGPVERSSSRNSYSPSMSDSSILGDAAGTSSGGQTGVTFAALQRLGSVNANSQGQILLNGQLIPGLHVNNVSGFPPIAQRSSTPDSGIVSLLGGMSSSLQRPTTPLGDISNVLNQPAAVVPTVSISSSFGAGLPLRSPTAGLGLPVTHQFAIKTSVKGNPNQMDVRRRFGQLGPGKGQFNSPHGFCLGIDEDIVVADTNNHRVQVFDKTGEFKYQFGIPGREEGQLWYPRKVAVMRMSGKYIVCDRGNERSRMQIFTKSGHFIKKISIRYIDIVAGVAVSPAGHIIAVDSVSPSIFILTEAGTIMNWIDCSDYMREPSDIAVSDKEFFVCDFKGHCVVVFNETGQFVRRIGCENITNFPNGIDISDAGDILVGDSHGNRFHVAVFQCDGSLIGEFECPYVKVSRCCGLKITSEGYVVTLAKNNHHVLVLNTLYIA